MTTWYLVNNAICDFFISLQMFPHCLPLSFILFKSSRALGKCLQIISSRLKTAEEKKKKKKKTDTISAGKELPSW